MQLAAHELRDLSELIAGCYNTINTMSTYIQQAQDLELNNYYSIIFHSILKTII